MVDIIHRVGIKAPVAMVFQAIATVEGITNWWTRETSGESKAGGTIRVRFLTVEGVEVGSMNIKVVSLEPASRVHWHFESGPEEWVGTDATFDLKQEGDYTIVLFGHRHWREAVEFTSHCSTKWATFLLSLKRLVEDGHGMPSPDDLKIDNWN